MFVEEVKTFTPDEPVETIKIKYFSDKVKELCYIDGKSDWIDLYAAEDVYMRSNEYALIPLGVAMELPMGYEAHIVPRSSTLKNYGIMQGNHYAVIDESYCGDNDQWFFCAYAIRETEIHAGDRICQFRIEKHQPKLNFVRVEHLDGEDRGGFGSTGTR